MKNFIITAMSGLVLLAACKHDQDNVTTIDGAPQATPLELFAEVEEPVGNIAYYDGGLIYSHHPFFNPQNRVMKYDARTKTSTPFPNQEWNTPKADQTKYLNNVLGLRTDTKGVVWMLDMGTRKDSSANYATPKLVGWNTRADQLEQNIPIPAPASLSRSQLNDLVIDERRNIFIIADEDIGPDGDGSRAALLVVKKSDGKARRLLEGHYSTKPENIPIVVQGLNGEPNTPINVNGNPLLVGADGITADKDNEWLYYAPLNGRKVYRIKIDDLVNEALTPDELGRKVETYLSVKENNGSLSMDQAGNLYLSNLESNSIGVALAGKLRPLYRYVMDDRLLWPDGASSGGDGYMYVPATQLHLAPLFQGGVNKTTKPFQIFRFRPLALAIPGR